MEKLVVSKRVKEIIIDTLNLELEVGSINDDTPLFGSSDHPGLFDNSLCVLEVTSGLIDEFDIEPSIFKNNSFKTIGTLTDCIFNAINKV